MTTVQSYERKGNVDTAKVGESNAGANTFRCKPCDCSRSKINRILQKRDRDRLEDESKLLGKSLEAGEFILKAIVTMETMIKDGIAQITDRELYKEKLYDWLDEHITELYKHKPKQAAAVIKNAEQMYDKAGE